MFDTPVHVDARWFQDRLADARLSQRTLARHLRLDPAAVSLMIHGKRKMSAAEAAEIARLLNVSVTDVLVRAGVDRSVYEGDPAERGKTQPAANVGPGRAIQGAGEGTLEIPVPLGGGGTARLILPRRLAKMDAERIAALLAAFAVD